MSDPFVDLDATAQAELVRSGQASPAELVDAAIARIEKLNPDLNAVIHERFEAARREAAAPLPEGPFRGVPFLLKDLGGSAAGDPFHLGSAFLKNRDFRAARDAYFTEKIRRAGFVILGRTNTPELGLMPTTEPTAYGPSRNPWSPSHSPGGSSGGGAAAVAARLVPVAHASDGGGSIRIPAAHCGLVGLKPTRGRSSFGPDVGERWHGFSVELVVSHSVRDTAGVLDAVAGPMPGDPYAAAPPARPFAEALARDPDRLRIGLLARGVRDLALVPECEAAVRHTASLLGELGHEIEESHPAALDDPELASAVAKVIMASTARALAGWAEKTGVEPGPEEVEPSTWTLAQVGRQLSAPDYLGAIDRVHGYGRQIAAWFDEGGFDLLLSPTCADLPPELGSFASPPDQPLAGFARAAVYACYTSPFNATGQPGISLPLHWSASGLPVGSQLVARTGGEDLLLQVAAQVERAHPWMSRKPPICA